MRAAVLFLAFGALVAWFLFGGTRTPERPARTSPEAEPPAARTRLPEPPPIRKGPGIVEGIVRDADGEPVAGARVRARIANGSDLSAAAHTDAAGRFTLRGLPLDDLWLIARTDEAVSNVVEVNPEEPDARNADFVLQPAGLLTVRPRLRIEGRVGGWWDGPRLDRLFAPIGRIRVTIHWGAARYHVEADVPGELEFAPPEGTVTLRGTVDVPGAQLELRSERATLTTTAGADGKFAFAGAVPGRAHLTATAPGRVPFARNVVVGRDEDIAVRLLRGWTLQGFVRDWDGDPIADARVTADRQETRSETDGSFRLPGLPHDENVSVEAVADGFLPQTREVTEGRTAMFSLERGWTLRGTVEDGAGALVVTRDPEWIEESQPYASAIADENGAFELEGLPNGRAWLVEAWSRGRRSAPAGPFARPPAEPLRLVLRDAGVLLGIVRDASGAPVEHREVTLVYPPRTVSSGADGRFAFGGLEPGRYVVYTWPERMKPVDVPSGPSNEIVLRSRSRYAISGVAVKADGTPAADAELRARRAGSGWEHQLDDEFGLDRASTTTDAQGRFRLAGLLGGLRQYDVSSGTAVLASRVRASATGLRLVWRPEPVVARRVVPGVVLDAAGERVPRARLWSPDSYPQTVRVNRGAFELAVDPHTPEIEVVVEDARAEDGTPLPAARLRANVALPADGELLEVRLPGGRKWRARVVDERGRGVSGAIVEIAYEEQQDDGNSRIERGRFEFDYPDDAAVAGPDGRFEFPALHARPFHARVKGRAEFVYAEPFAVRDPAAVPEIVVRDAAVLEGRVVGPDGHGIADVAVLTSRRAWDDDPRWNGAPFARTDGRGRFRLGSLVPGRITTLYLRPDAGASTPFLARSVEIRPGAEPVTLRLERGHWIRGEVVDDRGQIVLDGMIRARRPGTTGELAVTFLSQGARFRIGPLPAGSVELSLHAAFSDTSVFLDRPHRVQVPAKFQRIPARTTWTVRGRLSRPLGGFEAQWMGAVKAKPSRSVNEDGAFELPGLRDDEGRVYAFSYRNGSDFYALAEVRREEGEPLAKIELELKQGRSIRGRFSGRLDGVNGVQLLLESNGLLRTVVTRADGSFAVRGLPPGTWRIVRKGGAHPVEARAGATDVVVPGP